MGSQSNFCSYSSCSFILYLGMRKDQISILQNATLATSDSCKVERFLSYEKERFLSIIMKSLPFI